MRIPSWMLWTFVVMACLAGFVMAVSLERIIDATATASAGRARVWLHTPFVGPGQPVWLSVEADGDLLKVVVDHEGEVLREWTGREPTFIWLDVRMPERTGIVPLRISMESRPSRELRFARQQPRVDAVPLDVASRPLGWRLAWRAAAAALALAFWLQAVVATARVIQWVKALDERPEPDRNLSEGVGAALCVVLVAYALLGYWAFVLPLYAATGWVGSLPALLWMAIWVVGAGLAGYRLHPWLARPRPS